MRQTGVIFRTKVPWFLHIQGKQTTDNTEMFLRNFLLPGDRGAQFFGRWRILEPAQLEMFAFRFVLRAEGVDSGNESWIPPSPRYVTAYVPLVFIEN